MEIGIVNSYGITYQTAFAYLYALNRANHTVVIDVGAFSYDNLRLLRACLNCDRPGSDSVRKRKAKMDIGADSDVTAPSP